MLNPLVRLWFTSSGLILGGHRCGRRRTAGDTTAAHCDTGRSDLRMNERLSSRRSGWKRSGSGAGGLLTYRGVKIANSLAERERDRDRQKCDYSSHAYAGAIAAAPTHRPGFGRVPPQVHMLAKSQREQHQFSLAPSFPRIAISLRRARARRDITVPAGTPVTSLISR
jgi:hypothetical protein